MRPFGGDVQSEVDSNVVCAQSLGVTSAASAATLHVGRVCNVDQLEAMGFGARDLLANLVDLVGRDGATRIGWDDAGTAYAFDHDSDLIGHLSSV